MNTRLLIAFALLFAFLCVSMDALAQKKRLYRWVDESGNVFYSDQVPPAEVDRAREEFSERGTRAAQIDRAPTAEERRAAAEAAAAAAEAQLLAAEEERTKRNLVLTFPDEEDLIRTQQQRVDMIEGAITASRASLSSQERSLASMLSHAADAERAGQRVPANIADSIATLRQQVELQMAQIAEKEAEKEAALREHEVELERYRSVKEDLAGSRR